LPLTVTGLSAKNKVYDGTTSAIISGTPVLSGLGSSSVSLSGAANGAFGDKNVGPNKPVSVSGLSLSGGVPSDYSLTLPTLSANITAKTLVLTGLSASSKPYDGTTAATLSGAASLLTAEPGGAGSINDGRPYAGDTVSLNSTVSSSFTGTFASKEAAPGIVVRVVGNLLIGAQAGNYGLSGTDEENGSVTADISPKTLTVTGLSAGNKTYDATTAASLSGTAALQTAEAPGVGSPTDGKPYTGDTVSLAGVAAGTFATTAAGKDIAVTITGLSLDGAQKLDYGLMQPTLLANILAPTPTIDSPVFNSSAFSVSINTVPGASYNLEYKTSLSDSTWSQSASVVGDGSTKVLADQGAASGSRFYRIRITLN